MFLQIIVLKWFNFKRRDPAEFMQIHGVRYQIHVDAAMARAAESTNSLYLIELFS